MNFSAPFIRRPIATTLLTIGLALAGAVVCYRLKLDTPLPDVGTLFSASAVNPAVRAMRQALRISNEESEQMRGTLAGIDPLLADNFPPVARLKRFLAEPTSTLSRQLMQALAKLGHQVERIAELEGQFEKLEQTNFAPDPLIDGDILTDLGMKPGPIFKRILNEVYDAQLEGRVATREEAVRLATELERDAGA